MRQTNQLNAMQKAIDVHGQQFTAKALQLSPQFISNIYNGRKKLPATRTIDLEKICGGEVSRYQLRPDIFGKESDARASLCGCSE